MGNESAGIGMSFSFGPGKDRPGSGPGDRKPDPPRASFSTPGSVEVPAEATRILVMANFRGAPLERDAPPRRVRIATLDQDFVAFAPTLRLDVPDLLGGGKQPLEVEARLKARADLRPDRLAAAIPALAPVVELLDDIDGLAAGKLDPGRVEARRASREGIKGLGGALAALDRALRQGAGGGGAPAGKLGGGALDSVFKAGAAAASGDAVVDSIFSMIDTGEGAPPAKSAPAAPAREGGGSGKAALDQAREAALDLLERQLGEVLRHPQVRQLEGAWRGLELLLARCPREGGVEVEAYDCDPDAPEEALVNGVVRRHTGPQAPPPPSLVVMDASFSRTAADLARLELIAEAAEALQAPVVVGLGEAFLGTPLPALAGLDHPGGALERGLEKWQGLRGNPTFRWLVGATNRVLLRPPFRRGQRGARVGERVSGPQDLLWGNPGWIVATAAAASAGRTGWPSDLTDPEGVSDLPMDPEAEAPELRGPLEAPLALEAVEALAEIGVLGLTGPRDRDVARITRAPTAHRAPQDEPRWLSGLPYQLVATRIAGALMRAKDRLVSARDPEQVRERVERFAAGLVGDTGPGAGAAARLVQGDSGAEVEVEIRTGRGVLGGVTLTLGLAL